MSVQKLIAPLLMGRSLLLTSGLQRLPMLVLSDSEIEFGFKVLSSEGVWGVASRLRE